MKSPAGQKFRATPRKLKFPSASISTGIGKSFRQNRHPRFSTHMLTPVRQARDDGFTAQMQRPISKWTRTTPVEDCGIALGQALRGFALGDKRGIRPLRARAFIPKNPFTGEAYVTMDECLARCVIDFSGRPPPRLGAGWTNFSQKKISDARKKKQDASSAFRFWSRPANFSRGFTNEARLQSSPRTPLPATSRITSSRHCSRAFARATDAGLCARTRGIAGQLPSTKGKTLAFIE